MFPILGVVVPTSMSVDGIAADAFGALVPVVAAAVVVGFAMLGVVIIVRMIKGGGGKVESACGPYGWTGFDSWGSLDSAGQKSYFRKLRRSRGQW